MSPIVPVKYSLSSILYFEPSASQLSSINQRLCLSQNSLTVFRSKGFPKVCAIITALVFSDNAFSSIDVSILY